MSLHKTTETSVHDISLTVQAGHPWVGMWETYFNITSYGAGQYEFEVRQSGSTALWIDSHEVLESLCDNRGTGSIDLDAGAHNLKLLLFDDGENDEIELWYTGPDTNFVAEVVPASIFLPGVMCAAPCPAPPTPPPPCPSSLLSENESSANESSAQKDANSTDLSASASEIQDIERGSAQGDRPSGTVRVRRVSFVSDSESSVESGGQDQQQQRERLGNHHHRMPKDRHIGELLPFDDKADRLAT